MKRPGLHLVVIAATLAMSQPSLAQAPRTAPTNSAALETVLLRAGVYGIFGAGSNIVMQVGEDGIVLVDSGSAAMADQVLAEVRKVSKEPIRLIINTSADGDHIGGNERIARQGARMDPRSVEKGSEVLAHEDVLNRVSAPTGQQSAFPVASWPTDTYISRIKSMYVNDEGIQVIHYPSAHSDGDSVVFFRRADVIVTGDILDLRHFPVIEDRKSTRLNSSHVSESRMPSSA